MLILEAKKAEQPKAAADAKEQRQLALASDDLVWHFDWSGPDARLTTTSFENSARATASGCRRFRSSG